MFGVLGIRGAAAAEIRGELHLLVETMDRTGGCRPCGVVAVVARAAGASAARCPGSGTGRQSLLQQSDEPGVQRSNQHGRGGVVARRTGEVVLEQSEVEIARRDRSLAKAHAVHAPVRQDDR